ncbi:hypothetical protein FZEAL_5891 [Fusarium zealandicum]|uniref:Uncharacterized protein n=1 Tax=Fusarium zealandicum TaxID=1053134 RepID=A0A8H4UJL4_9HYPO|nr:hypothetical protein FZEAL_5891 [Fusarium zealandicum]
MRPFTPKRLVLALAIVTAIIILLISLPPDSRYLPIPNPFSADIFRADPSIERIRVRPDDFRVLMSTRNNLGFYNTINADDTGEKIMNPTLLELPKGSKHDFLVIARAPHVDKVINGRKYRLARQIATFVDLSSTKFGRPELKAGEWHSFILEEDFTGPQHHCKRQPDMDKYIGPEDMKLFWTRLGAPILIFVHQVDDENLCQGMFLIDARAAIPELVGALGSYAKKMPPINITEPILLHREPPNGEEEHPRYQREKNWAPTQSIFSADEEELLFMVEPGQLFRFRSEDKPVALVTEAETESAVQEPFPPSMPEIETWHSDANTCMHDVMLDNQHVHQSTPMLSVTLCNRGECEPSKNNTVMIGMVQQRYDPPGYSWTWYDHRIAVYSAAAPFNMMSVSKKLTYHGEADGKGHYTWTGSMIYYVNGRGDDDLPQNRSHGYLDDEIWLSFGIGDSAPGWLDIKAKELVTDHYMCQGAQKGYLAWAGQGKPEDKAEGKESAEKAEDKTEEKTETKTEEKAEEKTEGSEKKKEEEDKKEGDKKKEEEPKKES